MASPLGKLKKIISDKGVRVIDLKFIDLFGRWRHITIPAERACEELFSEGEPFDASSTPGYKTVESGDMVMIPDIKTAEIDPFCNVPALSMICDICEADTKKHFKRDPRGISLRAEEYVRSTLNGATSLFSPEFEFYIFDSVNVKEDINTSFYMIDSVEASWNSGMDGKNLGHKIPHQGGYHAIPPLDQLFNLRNEMAITMENMNIPVRYHHHEVGGPGQSEIEVLFSPLTKTGDNAMRTKHIIKNLAEKYDKTVTFMPKPLYNEAGSGMHFHQYLIDQNGGNLFWDPEGYAGLSDTALYYIGGLLKHGKALLALTNPSTNSYKRLVPGFEAPTKLFFGQANRSAAIRIPKYANTEKTKRIEFRPPDATCNIYLAMTAQLMAGIDGIENKIDPRELDMGPYDINVKDIPIDKLDKISSVPSSLMEACKELEADHQFLLKGDVFSEGLIQTWIEHKITHEYYEVRNRPHPHEIKLYFDM